MVNPCVKKRDREWRKREEKGKPPPYSQAPPPTRPCNSKNTEPFIQHTSYMRTSLFTTRPPPQTEFHSPNPCYPPNVRRIKTFSFHPLLSPTPVRGRERDENNKENILIRGLSAFISLISPRRHRHSPQLAH
jgi:hypothetical protein